MNTFRISALFAAIIKGQRLAIVKISGDSMAPTYEPGKLLLVANLATDGVKRTKQLENIAIDDVVVFTRETQLMVKRVKRINKATNTGQLMIWVEGDNKLESIDSRQWGPIPLDLVEAKVLN